MKTAEKEASSALIDVRKAAEAAMNYCRQLFPKTSVTLEEVEVSEDESHWFITLGVHNPDTALMRQVLKTTPWAIPPATKLKVFKVDAATGRVVSMKIR